MASIKVKLRPSTVEGRTGVVFYQITHNRKNRQITTMLRVQPFDWNADEENLSHDVSDRSMTRSRIDSDVRLLLRLISGLDRSGAGYSAEDVAKGNKLPRNPISVLDYMRTQIEVLRASNRLGTARNYEKTMSSFGEFLGGERLPICALTGHVIANYNAFLVRRGLVRNSVSFYMRVLRAVYNKAVRQGLVVQSHPFTEVYTGIDHTRKRAVLESVIARLHRLELPEGSQLALTRDLFIFSYCTRGMAFVDIAYLRKANLQNGVICYARRKTGQLLSVKIEPCVQRIIDRYSVSESPYVFPILTSVDAAEAYGQYRTALNHYNRLLGRFSDILGCGCKLTSYTSRHSWATAARNHDVPISVISQGMGHTTEQTTRIYLTMLENSVIDEANKKIIGCLA